MKLENLVIYENGSGKFDFEHCWIKVKVTVDLQKFPPFATVQTVRSYNTTLAQARKLILTMCVHLIQIHCTIKFMNIIMLQ